MLKSLRIEPFWDIALLSSTWKTAACFQGSSLVKSATTSAHSNQWFSTSSASLTRAFITRCAWSATCESIRRRLVELWWSLTSVTTSVRRLMTFVSGSKTIGFHFRVSIHVILTLTSTATRRTSYWSMRYFQHLSWLHAYGSMNVNSHSSSWSTWQGKARAFWTQSSTNDAVLHATHSKFKLRRVYRNAMNAKKRLPNQNLRRKQCLSRHLKAQRSQSCWTTKRKLPKDQQHKQWKPESNQCPSQVETQRKKKRTYSHYTWPKRTKVARLGKEASWNASSHQNTLSKKKSN